MFNTHEKSKETGLSADVCPQNRIFVDLHPQNFVVLIGHVFVELIQLVCERCMKNEYFGFWNSWLEHQIH